GEHHAGRAAGADRHRRLRAEEHRRGPPGQGRAASARPAQRPDGGHQGGPRFADPDGLPRTAPRVADPWQDGGQALMRRLVTITLSRLLLMLVRCGTPPNPRFYALTSAPAPPASSASSSTMSVSVGPV